jgi:serine/threonine-protein kinase
LGPSQIQTPNLFGMPRLQAIAALTRDGLGYRGRHGFDQTAAVGTVFAQDPPLGQPIFPGATVTITWSDGPAPVTVPDVHGEPCQQATDQLALHHLKGTCTQVNNASVPVGEVVATVPAAGTTQQQGTAITVEVSKGPVLVLVPDVRGHKVTAAIKELMALGFLVSVPNYNPNGHVFDQSPAGGQKIPKGSTITLIM